ncbi:MAG: HAD hydrolase-like protein [Magnetovibrio sp.]|nr:HAD hydrolase-like protein [Magnetovibrio sp.]
MNAAAGAPPPETPHAILFDWDNTLVDTWPVIRDALNTTLTAFGHEPWTMAEVRVRVRNSVRDRFPKMFGDAWRDAADMFYARYEEIHMTKLEPAPGAAEMLAGLAERELYLGLVSNKRGDILRAEAEYLGWHDYFGAMVGANDAVRDKPAADPIKLALTPAGLEPGPSVWYAGDADIDMECAEASGCAGVLIRAEAPGPDEFSGFPPVLHFDGCMALSKFVDKM